MIDGKDAAETRRLEEPAAAADVTPRRYLVVFEGERSRMCPLPASGEIVIGRGEGAGIAIDDSAVSRQHARITLEAGGARIADLGSQNGTQLDGQPLVGEGVLEPGATITVGEVALVFCSPGAAGAGRRALALEALRERLEDEAERSLAYQRPLCVAVLAFAEPPDRPPLDRALSRLLRRMDAWCWSGKRELVVVLPETDAEAAELVARTLIAEIAPDARAGLASCPGDGSDAGTLLLGARAAAARSAEGSAAPASDAYRAVPVGEAVLLVADPAMVRLVALAERLAATPLAVLVCGETGSGKELLAAAVHALSPRAKGPFSALNCAALQDTLIESELFGHERGAFTGAVATRTGLLESADGGTVFLDEIGELSPAAQAKLLRVLETHRIVRVGDTRERKVDVRVVAATNRDLEAEVAAGRFRQDLLFRLNAATLWIPPLRERRREIPLLAHVFLKAACARAKRAVPVISDAAMQLLSAHPWPGNVRELRNVIDYAAAIVTEDVIEPWHLEDRLPAAPKPARAAADARARSLTDELRELERRRFTAALEATGGNQTRAAERLGVPLRTFVRKLKQYKIER